MEDDINMGNNFMLAVRERRAKIRAERNYRMTFLALTFIIGLLVGMVLQSVLSKYLDGKEATAVQRVTESSQYPCNA